MTDELVRVQPKISINICTHRYMNPFFVNSLLFMVDYMNATGLKFVINSHMGVSNIVSGRQQRINDSIKDMLEKGCTHTLFIDDDMVFSMDIVHKLLSESNRLTTEGVRKLAMGVNPCRKSPVDLYYTAKPLSSSDPDEFLKSKGKSGVAEVSACGLGVFLIETAILHEIMEPHFGIDWMPDASRHAASQVLLDLLVESRDSISDSWNERRDAIIKKIEDEKSPKEEHGGEDFFFIKRLRDHGVRIFVDQDISQAIGHAGEFIYSYGSYNTPVEAVTANA